jgi:oligopeptide transport system substrate-binding protein
MRKGSAIRKYLRRWRAHLAVAVALSLTVASGCFESEQGELYYGRVRVPRAQEFRWSDGGVPQVFDPALAAAPPDTDAVRALFEGLTDYDPQTLAPVAGVATRWESSADQRVWTFHLRPDARWSNGAPVTAQDFVRSWRRTLRLGDRAPHASLLANIVGAARELNPPPAAPTSPAATPEPARTPQPEPTAVASQNGAAAPTNATVPNDSTASAESAAPPGARDESAVAALPQPNVHTQPNARSESEARTEPELGVEALGDFTLRVRLERPDKNFPALVAHTVFRPVPPAPVAASAAPTPPSAAPTPEELQVPTVSNGAFKLAALTADNVVLERAQSYWNAATVALERVRFVNLRDTEAALAAYRAGDVDAVTNASVEPLAVKLLAPYQDFRRATFGALTYYEFNTTRPPFDDLRVRRALALAVDRQRLSADTLEGAVEPADKFLPTGEADGTRVEYAPAEAQRLLTEAGYPGGAGFPRVRLLVNRNEQHRAVAQAVAAMWRTVLGVETEIVLKNWNEYEESLRAGDYDVARRSLVMQTPDEETNMLALFARPAPAEGPREATGATPTPNAPAPTESPSAAQAEPSPAASAKALAPPLLTEAAALKELPALPVYFASSYALVKPYVGGFETNLLDAPSLQRVRIDTNWQPPPGDKSNR